MSAGPVFWVRLHDTARPALSASLAEVVRAAEDDLDIDPALAACVQLAFAGPHLADLHLASTSSTGHARFVDLLGPSSRRGLVARLGGAAGGLDFATQDALPFEFAVAKLGLTGLRREEHHAEMNDETKPSVDEDTAKILAEIPFGERSPDSRPLVYTNFSREDQLYRANGELHGNWRDSFVGACEFIWDSYIPEGAILKLEKVGKCPKGQVIMKAEHY